MDLRGVGWTGARGVNPGTGPGVLQLWCCGWRRRRDTRKRSGLTWRCSLTLASAADELVDLAQVGAQVVLFNSTRYGLRASSRQLRNWCSRRAFRMPARWSETKLASLADSGWPTTSCAPARHDQ